MKPTETIKQEAESKALADYCKAIGTVITVRSISGYKDDHCIDFDGVPVKVRVLATPESDLFHWVDEYLDPYWNVEPVEQVPELDGLSSFWTFGPSYRVTDVVESADNTHGEVQS